MSHAELSDHASLFQRQLYLNDSATRTASATVHCRLLAGTIVEFRIQSYGHASFFNAG